MSEQPGLRRKPRLHWSLGLLLTLGLLLLVASGPPLARAQNDAQSADDAGAADASSSGAAQPDAGNAPDQNPSDQPAPDQNAPAQSQPSPAARGGFPYGALLADIGDAPLAHDAGFRVLATTLSWARTEPSRGTFPFEQKDQWGQTRANDLTNVVNAAQKNSMRVGMRLFGPPDWAGGALNKVNPNDLEDYVYHAVTYAGPALAYVEVFNEPNLPGEWGGPPDPTAYARLMAAAYQGAKRADPSVMVINGRPSQRTSGRGGSMEDVDWLDGFLRAGGLQSVDALGVHAYLGNFDPSTDPSCTPMCFREVEQFHQLMTRYADDRPIYIGEMGTLEKASVDLGEFNWMELPSQQRADYLVKALQMANASYPWIAGATVFNLDYADVGSIGPSSEESWFSMLNPDRSPRPAYQRFQQARADGTLP
jgi:hypothetical protein